MIMCNLDQNKYDPSMIHHYPTTINHCPQLSTMLWYEPLSTALGIFDYELPLSNHDQTIINHIQNYQPLNHCQPQLLAIINHHYQYEPLLIKKYEPLYSLTTIPSAINHSS